MKNDADCGHEACPDEEGRCFRERFISIFMEHGAMTRQEAEDTMARIGRRLSE